MRMRTFSTLCFALLGVALLVVANASPGVGQEIQNLPPMPMGNDVVLDARAFFQAARTTCGVLNQTALEIKAGVYWIGVQHGAIGAAVLATIAYAVFVKQQPPKVP